MKMGKKRLTYEYVKDQIEKKGFYLLSDVYVSNKKELLLKCHNGHTFTSTYNTLCGCPTCYGNKKLSYAFVKEQFEKEGYVLLSPEYKNSKSKLSVKCPKGHIFSITYANFYNGFRCSVCYVRAKKSYAFVKEQFEKEGYVLLSPEYKNSSEKMLIKCSKGHIWKTTYNSFSNGHRCIHCSHIDGGSTPEKELLKYIKTLYDGKIIENDRTTIRNYWTNRPLELDIYLPNLKKAIEYGAEYYHRTEYSKWKDMMKIKQCNKKGIVLMCIDDNEWKKNKIECQNKIKNWMVEKC